MNKGNLFPIILIGFLLTACAMPMMTIPPNPSNPIETVAVLPMYNATNDVVGPKTVRELTEKRIKHWQYTSKPLNEVDMILRDQMGVTLGSQLELTTPQKLGAALGVDGVLYGYLVDFGDVTTGLFNEKRVRAGFRLVDTKTGKVVWAGGRGVRNQSGALEAMASARDEGTDRLNSVQGVAEIPGLKNWESIGGASDTSFKMAMGEKLLMKATGIYLKPETEAMLDRIFNNFPAGRGTGHTASVKLPEVSVPQPPNVGNPFMSYMKAGEKDFTSDLVMTSVFKKENREMVIHGKLAKRGENFRTDIDMSRAMEDQEKGMPSGLYKTTMISQGKTRKNYTLYPDLKKYMDIKVIEDDAEEPKVTRKKLGEEVVDGHKCDKYQVELTDTDGKPFQGLIWEAKDLDGFVIRTEFEDGSSRQTMELKNVKLVTPPASLFEVPKDYTLSAGFLDLMSE